MTSMVEMKRPIGFLQLLATCHRVEVPLIQRDYAQGRESEKEVRDHFLQALYDALTAAPGTPGMPLNLDFVYGRQEGGKTPRFLPLDGQQRLTTLFLLHWYLAWRDARLVDFRQALWDGTHARFTYSVRTSSTEFFDKLVTRDPPAPLPKGETVRKWLENEPWFFLEWRLDPTIQSALTMLDAIHTRFESTSGLYTRITDAQQPAITFYLLPLEHFGLSDDLYIKMNARGKPLTEFETFKARFEEQLTGLFDDAKRHLGDADVSVAQFFESRMDTRWSDFFWHLRTPGRDTFDDAAMNLFWAVARVCLSPEDTSVIDDATLQRTLPTRNYTVFHEHGWLTRDFAENLICLLEAWSSDGDRLATQLPDRRYFDENAFFDRAVLAPGDIEFDELLQFAAFVFYVRHHEDALQPVAFQEWMRVVRNLSVNTVVGAAEYGRCLAGLQKLLPYSGNILEHLATMGLEPLGFSPQQVREEMLKAQLLLAHPAWRARIDAAEKHGYFQGQIEFLFSFSGVSAHAETLLVRDWPEGVHAEHQASFDHYLKLAQVTFDGEGLASTGGQYLWERALLATGDYLMHGGSNYSFGSNPRNYWDSWKRFLRGDGSQPEPRRHLKKLWEGCNPNIPIEPQLQHFIDTASDLEPWQAAVIYHPEIIAYCEEREIRWQEEPHEVYLLRRHRMSGAHAELFSYTLHLELSSEVSLTKIAPLTVQPYQSVARREKEPYVRLSWDRGGQSVAFTVESVEGQFRIRVNRNDVLDAPELAEFLQERAQFAEVGEFLTRTVQREEIHEVLRVLAQDISRL